MIIHFDTPITSVRSTFGFIVRKSSKALNDFLIAPTRSTTNSSPLHHPIRHVQAGSIVLGESGRTLNRQPSRWNDSIPQCVRRSQVQSAFRQLVWRKGMYDLEAPNKSFSLTLRVCSHCPRAKRERKRAGKISGTSVWVLAWVLAFLDISSSRIPRKFVSASRTPLFLFIDKLCVRRISIQTWARAEARKRLDASGEPWQYKPSPNSDYPNGI